MSHGNFLPAGVDQVIMAANRCHRYYVDESLSDALELKVLYARMIIEMRKDGFEETTLTVKGIAMNMP